ncbi:hypothetical protein G1C95_0566 [Bifidobacterium sp. DSM 109957]|uniref:Uncharacterized protein n=1 Tax=Bifidobacterium oedipodis TaxID=2675322 RepID=A0A7Y0ENB3_9BIFI|nr:hypothetical protein [Bifidobacterium sp. DSM 109957]
MLSDITGESFVDYLVAACQPSADRQLKPTKRLAMV